MILPDQVYILVAEDGDRIHSLTKKKKKESKDYKSQHKSTISDKTSKKVERHRPSQFKLHEVKAEDALTRRTTQRPYLPLPTTPSLHINAKHLRKPNSQQVRLGNRRYFAPKVGQGGLQENRKLTNSVHCMSSTHTSDCHQMCPFTHEEKPMSHVG